MSWIINYFVLVMSLAADVLKVLLLRVCRVVVGVFQPGYVS